MPACVLVHGGVYRAPWHHGHLIARRTLFGWCIYRQSTLNARRQPEFGVTVDGYAVPLERETVRALPLRSLTLVWTLPASYPWPERHEPDGVAPLG